MSVHWVPIQRSGYLSLRSAATTPLIMGWSTILSKMHAVSMQEEGCQQVLSRYFVVGCR